MSANLAIAPRLVVASNGNGGGERCGSAEADSTSAAIQISRLPRTHHHVTQRKYKPELEMSRWDRFLYLWIYLPLFGWFYETHNFIPPGGKDKDGYFTINCQGCYVDLDDARHDAARYARGFVIQNMPLNGSFPDRTIPGNVETFSSAESPPSLCAECVAGKESTLISAKHIVQEIKAAARAARQA